MASPLHCQRETTKAPLLEPLKYATSASTTKLSHLVMRVQLAYDFDLVAQDFELSPPESFVYESRPPSSLLRELDSAEAAHGKERSTASGRDQKESVKVEECMHELAEAKKEIMNLHGRITKGSCLGLGST